MKHTLMELHLIMEQTATLDMVKTITDKYKSKVPPNLKIQFTSYEEKSEKGDYQVEDNTIRLKKRHKNLQDFIETVLHEIHHAMDAKRYNGRWGKGPKGYEMAYEVEMSYQEGLGKDRYDDNKYEINAENFGKKNWKKWYNKFKKEGLF